jgi:hypothetical protein
MLRVASIEGNSRRILAGAFALALAATASGVAQRAAAAAEGGFSGLAGSWTGGGTISTASGNSERIRCRVNYAVGAGGNSVHQDLRCASDSYNFQVASDIVNQGGVISGTWSEVTRGVSGNVSGRMSGGAIQVGVTGPAFTAGLSISTSGSRQTVMIRPSGGDIRDVSVSLSKGR